MRDNDTTLVGIARRTTLSVLLLVTGAAGTAAAQAGHGGGMTGGGGLGGVGLLWMVVLLAVPVVFVYLLAKGLSGDGRTSDSSPSRTSDEALSMLRERYARGDLSDEEFERRRNRLR